LAKRQLFSSHTATILTMIGVSVGLGNVWRFPYMMGKYGGSAFLFIYLIFTMLFGIPAMISEWVLGRKTRKGPIGAFTAVAGSFWGKVIGSVLLITVLVADSYYIVVIANVIYTAYFSAVHGFTSGNMADFHAGLSNGYLQYAIAVAILLASLYVIHRGLNKGIETVSKLFVPFFGAIVIYLVLTAFSLEGAPQQFATFLKPDFTAMHAKQVFAALGQAFFSLGLGGTFLLIYGSYLKDDQDIFASAVLTALGDTGAALFAALFIIPSILVFGLDMTVGPGLIFSTLPTLFSDMSGGRFLGSTFMVALFMVAFLSNIAALEVLAGGVNDGLKKPLSRSRIIVMIGILEVLLMFPSSVTPGLIGILDLVFGSGMQVLGSTLAVLGLTWGFGKSEIIRELFGSDYRPWQSMFYFWIKWVVPGALLFILMSYIYNFISG